MKLTRWLHWYHWIYPTQNIFLKTNQTNVGEVNISESLDKKIMEYVFSVNDQVIKQIDGWPICVPISVVFSDVYMCKMAKDMVVPVKAIFYRRYIDNTYVRRIRNIKDELIEKLFTYHENIELTIEMHVTKILDKKTLEPSIILQHKYKRSLRSFQFSGVPCQELSTNALLSLQNYTDLNQLLLTSTWALAVLRRNSWMLVSPYRLCTRETVSYFQKEKESPLKKQWLFEEIKQGYIRLPFVPGKLKAFENID